MDKIDLALSKAFEDTDMYYRSVEYIPDEWNGDVFHILTDSVDEYGDMYEFTIAMWIPCDGTLDIVNNTLHLNESLTSVDCETKGYYLIHDRFSTWASEFLYDNDEEIIEACEAFLKDRGDK